MPISRGYGRPTKAYEADGGGPKPITFEYRINHRRPEIYPQS
jgi:hypothetical protein